MKNHKLSRPAYLLICLIEECAEVIQRACKALRFGMKEIQPGQAGNLQHTNEERLRFELCDLAAVRDLLINEQHLRIEHVQEVAYKKTIKLERFYAYSVEQGCAEDLREAGEVMLHIDVIREKQRAIIFQLSRPLLDEVELGGLLRELQTLSDEAERRRLSRLPL